MVSQNPGLPAPLPLHVPPGHVVQQILDENGALRHLILSPQTPPIGGFPQFPSMTLPNGLSFMPTPSGAPCAAGPSNVPYGATTPGSGPMPGPPPPSLLQPAMPMGGSPSPPSGDAQATMQAGVQMQQSHEDEGAAGHYGGDYPPVTTSRGPRKQTTYRHPPKMLQEHASSSGVYTGEAEYPETLPNTQSNEEQTKLIELLSKLQPPQVTETGAREALISWQRIDCSDASCGPFPEIEASDFIYEALVSERNKDGKYTIFYRGGMTEHRICELKPATEYYVKLRAIIDPYTGSLTEAVGFCTQSCKPDRPSAVRIEKKTKTSVALKWNDPRANGAKISTYHLECDSGVPVGAGSGEATDASYEEVYSGADKQYKISRLNPGTTYRFRVSAENKHGKSDFSEPILVTTSGIAPAAPDPPQLVEAEPYSLQLMWEKRAGDDDFHLQMDDPQLGYGFITVCNGRELSCICSELRHSQDYHFRLCASNEDGTSPWSVVVTYRTRPTRPAMPGRPYLKGRIHPTSVRVVWDAPTDNGGSEVRSYMLEACCLDVGAETTAADGWAVVYAGAEREYNCSGLLPGRTYHFRVSCSSEGGQSGYSDVLAVQTLPVAPGACRAPALQSKPKANSVHLKWGPPEQTGGAEITQYEVRMTHPDGAAQMVVAGLRLDCAVASLAPGRSYTFAVRAHNKAGAGAWSEPFMTVTGAGPPDAPGEINASAKSPYAVAVSWQPPSANGSTITEYRLQQAVRSTSAQEEGALPTIDETGVAEMQSQPSSTQSSPTHRVRSSSAVSISSGASSSAVVVDDRQLVEGFGEFVQVYAGAASVYELKNLTPASEYAFRVQAVNYAGPSRLSNVCVCRTPPAVPSQVQNVQAEAVSTTEIALTWEEPVHNGASVEGYQIEMTPAREAMLPVELEGTATQYTVGGLAPETNYRIRVLAVNSVGPGAWSLSVRASTYSLPPQPPLLECIGAGHNALKLRWADPVATQDQLQYSLEMENRNGSFSPVYEGTGRSHKVPRLAECTLYRFRIRATSPTGGAGRWSETVAFMTGRAPPPALKNAPRVSEVNANSWQVEWPVQRVPLPAGERIHYCLQLSSGRVGLNAAEEFRTIYQGLSTSYTVSGLAAGQAHRVRVCLVRLSPCGDGTTETVGPPSPTTSFTTAVPNMSASNSPDAELDDDEAREASARRSRRFPSLLAVWRGEEELTDSQLMCACMIAFALVAVVVWFILQYFFVAHEEAAMDGPPSV